MSHPLEPGTAGRPTRIGRYDVYGVIGQGGMGAVYDAVDREHGTRVALKTLTHLDASSLLQFKNEFRAVADLHHDHLVKLYELGCHEGLWYFTMERVHGGDFVRWVRGAAAPAPQATGDTVEVRGPDPAEPAPSPTGPMPSLPPSIPRLRDALAQLVSGVRALHGAGLLHLDLKPANVLVEANGRVVVLDFGLVRPKASVVGPVPEDTDRIAISGTPMWMAPEQFVGREVGEASDWYAVGLMLYVALTGAYAYAETNVGQIWYAKQNVPPVPPDLRLGGAPSDLSALAVGLLHANPAVRPSGATIALAISSDETTRDRIATRLVRPDVVGRDAEREQLHAALRVARGGRAALVRVVGASGIGKSALLASFADEARAGGDVLALRGRCYERETVPYKAFDGMIDDLVARLSARGEAPKVALPERIRELAQVFPVLGRVPDVRLKMFESPPTDAVGVVELRRRAMGALRDLLASLASERPLVILLDDLQWADADSVAILSRMFEVPAPRGLLLIVSYRPEAAENAVVAEFLEAMGALSGREDAVVSTIEVGPLPSTSAESLAGTTLQALGLSASSARSIAAESGGVPLFVEELARASVHRREGETLTLDGVLARRVQSLPADERALLEVLAVANSPIPLVVAFAVAGVGTGALRALWSLSRGHFVRSTGPSADDRAELHHDRMREAVLRVLPPSRVGDLHHALGRALSIDARPSAVRPAIDDSWLFDAVRHLQAVPDRLHGEERRLAARLQLEAGQRARRGAAFPLAFQCFRAGAHLLDPDAWETDYALALGLHGGAAETAALSAAWGVLDEHVAAVKAHGRTMLDQLVAWEARIDAHIARHAYGDAVGEAAEALARLGVDLPLDPAEAEVGEAVGRAMEGLARIGPDGLAALPLVADPTAVAAMRVRMRIISAVYFAKPILLPLIASQLVTASIEHGLSPGTPYALAVYGIVLNTLGKRRDAHAWGQAALALVPRFEDRSLEARTLHVVHDLVCVWTVPLAGTLPKLHAAVAVGRANGDLEYAAYAAHAWVHNSFYAGAPLGPLLDEALALGAFMRGYAQVNALHVHVPFEQVLRCFTGRTADPASLSGDGFDEEAAIASAPSRSVRCIVPLLMGIVRYHFGAAADALACLERARPFLDGLASTWHVPIFHQYAALSLYACGEVERAEPSLSHVRELAEDGPMNFAHRVALLDGEKARASGDAEAALRHLADAIAGATAWPNDLGLAHELAARISEEDRAVAHRAAAREAWSRWGAVAKHRR